MQDEGGIRGGGAFPNRVANGNCSAAPLGIRMLSPPPPPPDRRSSRGGGRGCLNICVSGLDTDRRRLAVQQRRLAVNARIHIWREACAMSNPDMPLASDRETGAQ